MKKQRVILISFFTLFTLACVTPVFLLFGLPFVQEWRTKQGLEIMDGAEYLFEGYSVYGGSTALRSIYYWIDEPTDEVKNYYKHFATPLIPGEDEYGTWYIGLIKGDYTLPEQRDTTYIIHESLCSYQEHYDCVSITLIDVSQPDYFSLPASSPSQFRNFEQPLEFASLPEHGTLIVFSYFVSDY